MTKHIETGNTVSNEGTTGGCSTLPGIFQIAVGVLLITASAFGYSLMQHPAALLPAIMGAALLFHGARGFVICRHNTEFHNHHPSNGMTG
jgi:hypothetical protein